MSASVISDAVAGCRKAVEEDGAAVLDVSIDGELENGSSGPKKFSYHQRAAATRVFSPEGKLGEDGFGSVYRGYLSGFGSVGEAPPRIDLGCVQFRDGDRPIRIRRCRRWRRRMADG